MGNLGGFPFPPDLLASPLIPTISFPNCSGRYLHPRSQGFADASASSSHFVPWSATAAPTAANAAAAAAAAAAVVRAYGGWGGWCVGAGLPRPLREPGGGASAELAPILPTRLSKLQLKVDLALLRVASGAAL